MSAALRLAERLGNHDAIHPNVELFAATLLAPIYGRMVTTRREKVHGRIVTSSKPNALLD